MVVDEKKKSRLSRWESVFLSVSNLLIVTVVIIDLFHLSGLSQMEPASLALANLIILVFAFFSYRIKRRINIKAMRAREYPKGTEETP